jgi:hypothetical protein
MYHPGIIAYFLQTHFLEGDGSMVNNMLWLGLARLRDSFVAHSHAMPITPIFIEGPDIISVKPQMLHAFGGSSVPISRGSPPLYSR